MEEEDAAAVVSSKRQRTLVNSSLIVGSDLDRITSAAGYNINSQPENSSDLELTDNCSSKSHAEADVCVIASGHEESEDWHLWSVGFLPAIPEEGEEDAEKEEEEDSVIEVAEHDGEMVVMSWTEEPVDMDWEPAPPIPARLNRKRRLEDPAAAVSLKRQRTLADSNLIVESDVDPITSAAGYTADGKVDIGDVNIDNQPENSLDLELTDACSSKSHAEADVCVGASGYEESEGWHLWSVGFLSAILEEGEEDAEKEEDSVIEVAEHDGKWWRWRTGRKRRARRLMLRCLLFGREN